MTTFYEAEMKCAVCGTRSKQQQLGSTNTMGWPDLDTRPAPMQRSTIGFWVVQCPGCGYCASDLEKAATGARKTWKERLTARSSRIRRRRSWHVGSWRRLRFRKRTRS